jgi:3-hydroxybutyryl-CoA dehydratase
MVGEGYSFEDLEIGLAEEITHRVTEFDVIAFAAVSGDKNPIHLDEAYASATRFGTRIAHGMLSASYLSAVLGTRLPGPGAVYMSQSLFFRAPVKIGDTVTVRVEVIELFPEKSRVKLKTVCAVGETIVLEGEALMFVPGASV